MMKIPTMSVQVLLAPQQPPVQEKHLPQSPASVVKMMKEDQVEIVETMKEDLAATVREVVIVTVMKAAQAEESKTIAKVDLVLLSIKFIVQRVETDDYHHHPLVLPLHPLLPDDKLALNQTIDVDHPLLFDLKETTVVWRKTLALLLALALLVLVSKKKHHLDLTETTIVLRKIIALLRVLPLLVLVSKRKHHLDLTENLQLIQIAVQKEKQNVKHFMIL